MFTLVVVVSELPIQEILENASCTRRVTNGNPSHPDDGKRLG